MFDQFWPYPSLAAILLSGVAVPAIAQDMQDIGEFPDGLFSIATHTTGDGSVVVGTIQQTYEIDGVSELSSQPFRWAADGRQLLGTLRSDNSGDADVVAVSADGAVIIGNSRIDGDLNQFTTHAYRWTAEDGMIPLGALSADGSGSSSARDVSGDGSVIVGAAQEDNSRKAFRWTDGGMESLGTLRPNDEGFSDANAISEDGSTIIGETDALGDGGHTISRAFRWTAKDGLIDLGILQKEDRISRAIAVSADGSVIAGISAASLGQYRAFRWSEAGGMQDLGLPQPDWEGSSAPEALSADGSTIVGQFYIQDSIDMPGGLQQAFRWTERTGMVALGTLRKDGEGTSLATAVNADGTVVVGAADIAKGASAYYQAFRWTAEGMVGLGTLKADGTGNSAAYDVSNDGAIVVGASETDQGTPRAFIYRVRDADPPLEDPVPVGPGSPDPEPDDPAPSDPIPTDPTPNDPPSEDPVPIGPGSPDDPTPSDPIPVDPTPTDPPSEDPVPVGPGSPDPEPDDPAPSHPIPVDPTPNDPPSEDPVPIGPGSPDDPAPSDPIPVDPTPPGVIHDLANTQAAIAMNTKRQGKITQARNTVLLKHLNTELTPSLSTRFGPSLRMSTKGGRSDRSRRPVAIRLEGAHRAGEIVDDMGIAGLAAAIGATPELTFGGFLNREFSSEGGRPLIRRYLRPLPTIGRHGPDLARCNRIYSWHRLVRSRRPTRQHAKRGRQSPDRQLGRERGNRLWNRERAEPLYPLPAIVACHRDARRLYRDEHCGLPGDLRKP